MNHVTIVATDTDTVTLHNVTVTDPNVTNLSCTPGTTFANLAPFYSINCQPNLHSFPTRRSSDLFFNQACVDDGANGAAQKCASVDTPGTPNPLLSITKRSAEHTYKLH